MRERSEERRDKGRMQTGKRWSEQKASDEISKVITEQTVLRGFTNIISNV